MRRSRSTTTSRRPTSPVRRSERVRFPNGLRKGGINPANGLVVPGARPGGCTRDIVHRFYEEQFQLNGGQQNRYALQSDAAGLTMGTYDTKKLPVYKYLHAKHHPGYAILDNFFQAAFGGSYLNHQWLIAAATPVCNAANGCPANATHSVLDRNGSPTSVNPPASSQPPGHGRRVHLARQRSQQRRADAERAACRRRARGSPAATTASTRSSRRSSRRVSSGPSCPRRRTRRSVTGCPARTSTGPGTRAAGRTPTATYDVAVLHERRRRLRHADRLLRPERRPGRLALAGVPGQPVPVPPPAVQLLRGLLDADRRRAGEPRCSPAGRAGVHPAGRQLHEELQPEVGQLHQADRRGERASRLRERAERQRPPRRPAEGDRDGVPARRTRSCSSPTTSSAASGITSRRRARATTTARTTSGAPARGSRRSRSHRT